MVNLYLWQLEHSNLFHFVIVLPPFITLATIGGPVEKMSFFQMAPGPILSTQVHSDR